VRCDFYSKRPSPHIRAQKSQRQRFLDFTTTLQALFYLFGRKKRHARYQNRRIRIAYKRIETVSWGGADTMPCLTRSAGRRPTCKRGQLKVQSKMPEGVGHVGTLLLAPCAPRPGVEAAELMPPGPGVIEPRRLPCARVRPNTTCSEMMETVPGLFVVGHWCHLHPAPTSALAAAAA